MLGLYLHVPFCRVRCSYCDFYLVVDTKPGARARYVTALAREICLFRDGTPLSADTLFFGGGTPSLLTGDEIALLFGACRESFIVEENAEVSLEANPEDISLEKARALRRAMKPLERRGTARLTLGAQTFREEALRATMRPHGAGQIAAAFRAARAAGFDSVGLDLLCGLPGETPASWEEALQKSLALSPDHLSIYVLEWHEKTFLSRQAALGEVVAPLDDAVADMYESACDRLESEGFCHYEISNFARPGHESRHNLKYWSDAPYAGFGPGAHSYIGGRRWANAPNLTEYLVAMESGRPVPRAFEKIFSPKERTGERLWLSLRKRAGHVMSDEERAYVEARSEALRPLVEHGLLELAFPRIRLTRRGVLLSNEVFAVLQDSDF